MKCDICGKDHQKILKRKIKTDGKWIDVRVVKSPCIDSILKKAVNLTNSIIRKEQDP